MDVWSSGDNQGDEARGRAALAPVVSLPSAVSDESIGTEPIADTTVLDVLPHPAFAIAVDGEDVFRFIYTNDAYRTLRGEDAAAEVGAPAGDLRHVVPANALVAHVRAFARA